MESKNEKEKEKEVNKITNNWNQKSAELKEKFSHITESDLKLEKDKEEEWNKNKQLRLPKKIKDV